jgi:hypothetical protein
LLLFKTELPREFLELLAVVGSLSLKLLLEQMVVFKELDLVRFMLLLLRGAKILETFDFT